MSAATITEMFYEVILDGGETPNKCTISPLAGRPDFHLIPTKGAGSLGPLKSSILLNHEGPCLTSVRDSVEKDCGIAAVDCVWRRLEVLLPRIARPLPLLARIPDGFETAYPRRSQHNNDPAGGLATIEAIFVARAILGTWDKTLLSEFYFGRKFVEINRPRFLELGVYQAADPDALPVLKIRPKTSLQRRLNRGKSPFATVKGPK